MVKRSWSPSLPTKTNTNVQSNTIYIELDLLLRGAISWLRLGIGPLANRCHVFWLHSVAIVHPFYVYNKSAAVRQKLAELLHPPGFHIFSPPAGDNQKTISLHKSVADTFLLSCGWVRHLWHWHIKQIKHDAGSKLY